jgi:hypothetical protein
MISFDQHPRRQQTKHDPSIPSPPRFAGPILPDQKSDDERQRQVRTNKRGQAHPTLKPNAAKAISPATLRALRPKNKKAPRGAQGRRLRQRHIPRSNVNIAAEIQPVSGGFVRGPIIRRR